MYSCILMTYEPRQRGSKSRASQSRSPVAATVRASARCCRADGSRLFPLSSPGVSLPLTSAPFEAAASRGRCQGCLHGEAIPELGRTSAFPRCRHGSVVKQGCQSSVARSARSETGAWLSARPGRNSAFDASIGLIVCCQISWPKSTSCWRPISDGPLAHPILRRR